MSGPDTVTPWRLLLFSSNRRGGSGGYDLYLTALPDTVRHRIRRQILNPVPR